MILARHIANLIPRTRLPGPIWHATSSLRRPETLLPISPFGSCGKRTAFHATMAPTSTAVDGTPKYIRNDVKLSAVFRAMNDIAPLSMADTSWDNVGVQIQAPEPKRNTGDKVMLCNDLTQDVADEILARGDVAVVVTYHPIIFRGLKSLTMANTQQRSLLRLAEANISIYASHTSIDACQGGNADWLARIAAMGHQSVQGSEERMQDGLDVKAIAPLAQTYDDQPNAGMGRLVHLPQPASAQELVQRVKDATGLQNVILGLPSDVQATNACISIVAVAAGSAGSIVSKAASAQAWITGELSHHEALAAVEQGIIVILTLHGNSERAYLRQVLQKRLQVRLDKEAASNIDLSSLNVVVSEKDREPLAIV